MQIRRNHAGNFQKRCQKLHEIPDKCIVRHEPMHQWERTQGAKRRMLGYEILQKKYKGILCFGWKIAAEFDGNICELDALFWHFAIGQIIIEDLNRAGALRFNVLPNNEIHDALLDKR